MLTLFETFTEDKYDYIVVKLDNNAEFRIAQQVLFRQDYWWITDSHYIQNARHDDVFPIYLFILGNDVRHYKKKFFYESSSELDDNSVERTILHRQEGSEKDKICPHVFDISDIKNVDKLFNWVSAPTYKPRKIERTLETYTLNEAIDKSKGFAIYCSDRDEYERIKQDLISWDYMDNDGEYFDEDDLENYLLYPIIILVNAGDFDVFFSYAYDPFDDEQEATEAMSHFNEYMSPDDFYKDTNAVQMLKNKGVIVPSYNPRRMDRTMEALNEHYMYSISDFENFKDYKTAPIFKFGDMVMLNSNVFSDEVYMKEEFSDVSTWKARYIKLKTFGKPAQVVMKFYQERLDTWWSRIDNEYTKEIDGQGLWIPDEFLSTPAPSYEPRRMDRTLENLNESYKFIGNNDTLNTYTNRPEYGIGDTVVFRVDAPERYTRGMKELGISTSPSEIDYIMKNMDKKISVKEYAYDSTMNIWLALIGLADEYGGTLYVPVSTISSVRPSYKPRNFTRTLEGFINENFDIKTYPYRYLPFTFQDKTDVRRIVTHFHDKYGLESKNSVDFIVEDLYRLIDGSNYDIITVDLGPRNKTMDILDDNEFGLNRMREMDSRRASDRWTDSETYTVNDLRKFMGAPDYRPRRMDRTLEAYNNYKYDVVVFGTSTESESTYVQEQLFKQGYEWGQNHKRVKDFGSYDFPIYLFAKKDNHSITYMSPHELRHYDGNNIEGYLNHYKNSRNVCLTVFGYKDSDNVEQLLKWGQGGPSYAPRRMDRTLEAYSSPLDIRSSKYFREYNTLVFSVTSGDDYEDVRSFLRKLEGMFQSGLDGATNHYITDESRKEPQYIRMTLERWGGFDWGYSALTSFPLYAKNNDHTYRRIFSFNEISNGLEDILRQGDIVPSYKPRKIERTLEGLSEYPYRFKTEDEMIKQYGDNWRTSDAFGGIGWSSIDYESGDCPMDVYLGQVLPFKEMEFLDRRTGEKALPNRYNGWIIHWNMITPNKLNTPNYSPRRINRTLEGVTDGRYYNTNTNEFTVWSHRFKTEEEFEEQYGNDWMSRIQYENPDDSVAVSWAHDMEYLLGQDCQIENIDMSENRRYHLETDLTMRGYWLITNEMLVSNKISTPNYSPRRIDRTLEGIGDVPHCYRFKTKEEMIARYGRSWKYEITWNPGTMMDYLLGTRIDVDVKKVDRMRESEVVARIPRKPEDIETHYSDGDVWVISKDMLTRDILIPDYRPRKMDRTLEAHTYYPYRFKTEQEFIDTFGEHWRDDICDRGLNWAPDGEMDHLYGQDFPFEERQLNPKDSGYAINDRWDDPNSHLDWLIGWDMLTPNAPRVPDYSPKKINRTLESSLSESYQEYEYSSIVIKINDMIDLNKTKKYLGKYHNYNEIYLSMIDKFKFYNNPLYFRINIYQHDEKDWVLTQGTMDFLLKIRGTDDDDISYEKIFTVEDLENGLLDNFIKYGKTVLNPTYKPRKMDRTLESVDNKYNYDVHKSKYFNKYNTFVVVFNKYMELDVFHDVINMLSELFDDCLRTKFDLLELMVDIPNDEDNYYISFFYDERSGKWLNGWCNLGYLDSDVRHNPYKKFPRAFKYTSIDTWEKLKYVMDTGDVAPSYKPRKIERTTESKDNKYNIKRYGK